MSNIGFILLKPDALDRLLVGQILSEFESRGMVVVACKLIPKLTDYHIRSLYHMHIGQPYFDRLKEYMTSGPVMAAALKWDMNPTVTIRSLVGMADPNLAAPMTLRRKYGLGLPRNTIHASDSIEAATLEVSIFFTRDEVAL